MPTKLHAIVDYSIALLSIFSPLLFGFGEGGSETLVAISFGLLLILYNIFTDYDLGMSKQIPMYAHLRMDQVVALLMICSPWLFRFYDVTYVPHLLLGLALLVSSLLTGNELSTVVNALRNWEKWLKVPSRQ